MSQHAGLRVFVIAALSAFVATGCATFLGKETKVGMDQVPAAAKATIEKETAGGTIREIEKYQCCRQVIYEVEYVKDGRKIEVKFAEDGTIMECCKHGEKCRKCEK